MDLGRVHGSFSMPLARRSERIQERYRRRFHYLDPRLYDQGDRLIRRDCETGLIAYGANRGIHLLNSFRHPEPV